MSCNSLEFHGKDDVAFESWWKEKSKQFSPQQRRSAKRYAYAGWCAAQEFEWRKRLDSTNSRIHSIISPCKAIKKSP
jgi:hypothetical protein